MDLISFFRALIRNRYVLIAVPLTTVIAVFFITRDLPRAFKSKAQLATGITEAAEVSLSNDRENLQPFMISNAFSNLIETMKSRPVVSLISYKLILHDLYDEEPFRTIEEPSVEAMKKVLQEAGFKLRRLSDPSIPNAIAVQNDYKIQKLLETFKYDYETLKTKLKIERVNGSDFISVEFESENPMLSAFIVNEACTEFIRSYKNSKAIQSQFNVDFFNRLADKKKTELDNKVNSLKQFKLKNQIINLYEQTKALVDQIKDVEVRLENERMKIPALQGVIGNINRRFTGRDKLYIEAQTGILNRKVSFLKDKLNILNVHYIDGGMQDSTVRDSIMVVRKILDEQLRALSEAVFVNPNTSKQELVLRKINSELDLSMAKEGSKSLEREVNRLKSVVASYAPMEASIAALEREIQVASDVYLLILNKLNSAQFASMNLGGSLRQVEQGTPSEKPEASKRAIILALAGIISLVLCIIVIFVLEYIDNTIKTPMRFKTLTGLKLLGYYNNLKATKLDLDILFEGKPGNYDALNFSQLCRNFRHDFELATEGKKIILFTSPKTGEGKTFTIITLAYALNMIGKKILVIDTDFKASQLTEIYGARPLLNQLASNDPNFVISNTNLPGIQVIGSSPTNLSPVEVFKDVDFKKILEDYSFAYDFIFMESGNLSTGPNAKELIEYSDAVVCIYSADAVLAGADFGANRLLQGLNNKFAGALLNRVDMDNMEGELGEVQKQRSVVRKFFKNLIFRKKGSPSRKGKKVNVK